MESFRDGVIQPVKEMIERHKDKPHLEIEGRLGIFEQNRKTFDSNVGEEMYQKIQEMLDSAGPVFQKSQCVSTDFIGEGKRLTVGSDGSRVCVTKKKLESITFVNDTLPLDFRVSVSQELPCDDIQTPSDAVRRNKDRLVYAFRSPQNQSFHLDLTKVKCHVKDGFEETFEFEVEHVPSGTPSDTPSDTPGSSVDAGQLACTLTHLLLDANFYCDGFMKTESNALPLEDADIHIVKTFSA